MKWFNTICVVCLTLVIHAQSTTSAIFTPSSELEIVQDGHNFYCLHQIEKGHTLYSLANAFNTTVGTLKALNQFSDSYSIPVGKQIKVPVKPDYLFKGTTLSQMKFGFYIPVYYTVKPQETLYSLCKRYFNQPIEVMKQRNQLKDHGLSVGQKILIGWLPIDSAQPVEQHQQDGPSETHIDPKVEESDDLYIQDDPFDTTQLKITRTNPDSILQIPPNFDVSLLGSKSYQDSFKLFHHNEIAYWDQNMHNNGRVFALHRNAAIDTYLEIRNPVIGRLVKVKVIGRIPYGTFTDDVNLVLSPGAVEALGARDARFNVEVKGILTP